MRPLSEDIGRRLAAIRLDRGLRQTELARAIKRTKQALNKWEHNRSPMRLDDAEACAAALRCRLDDLLAPMDAPIPPHPAYWWHVLRRIRRPRPKNTKL
jgi:transcriptional regulator with XRE-family HTH domain